MKIKFFLFLIFTGLTTMLFGQKSTKSFFSPSKIGIQFTQGNESNFLFDDLDYFYRSNTLKGQVYFPLFTWSSTQLYLVTQPQIQFTQHQLYNEQFVKPSEENYIEKRQRYTQLKNLTISSLEFGLELSKKLINKLDLFIHVSLGFSYVDTDTERLAKGFTFIENGNLGLDFKWKTKTSIQLFCGLGHVSNFDFQMPNSGYNTFNTGIGFLFSLQ